MSSGRIVPVSNTQQWLLATTAVAAAAAATAAAIVWTAAARKRSYPPPPGTVARAISSYASRLRFRWTVLRPAAGAGACGAAGPRKGESGAEAVGTADAKGTVSQLFIHPVKSLRSVPKDAFVLDGRGPANDRRFMIVYPAPIPLAGSFGPGDATHRFLSQRHCPSLATVVADIDEAGNSITLTSHLMPDERATFPLTTPPASSETAKKEIYRASLWSDIVLVRDVGNEPAKFVQKLVQFDEEIIDEIRTADIRIVVQAEECGRTTSETFTPPYARLGFFRNRNRTPAVALTDGFPLLVASEASLAELNRRLRAKGKEELPMSRFRPNIVIQGTDAAALQPFEEDRWKVIRVGGDVVLHVVKPCPRCKESCTDQISGKVTKEPVETLSEFRALDPQNKENVYFAQNAIPDIDSIGRTIRVGDAIEVLQYGDPIYAD